MVYAYCSLLFYSFSGESGINVVKLSVTNDCTTDAKIAYTPQLNIANSRSNIKFKGKVVKNIPCTMCVVNCTTFSKQEEDARPIKKNTHTLQHKTIQL